MANRLELTRIGKEEPVEAEPRFLLERPDLSCHLAIAAVPLMPGCPTISPLRRSRKCFRNDANSEKPTMR